MSPGDVLRVDPQAEAVVVGDGRMLLRNGARSVVARGLQPAVLRTLVDAAADGSRTYDELAGLLAVRYPPRYAATLLQGLIGIVLTPAAPADAPEPVVASAPGDSRAPAHATARPVAVLGDGPLAAALGDALRGRGFSDLRRWRRAAFASCEQDDFRARRRERVPLARTAASRRDGAAALTPGDLDELLAGVDLCVCALEWVPYRAQLDLADGALRTATTVLFVTAAREGSIVGPTYVPGATACFECERLVALCDPPGDGSVPAGMVELLACHGLADDERGALLRARICAEVAGEVEALLDAPPRGDLLTGVVRLPADAERRRAAVAPHPRCSRCSQPAAPAGRTAESAAGRRALACVVVADDRAAAASPGGRANRPAHGYRSVCVLGGGTAGYLAALTFRARFPELAVTLIESSRVPVIGVGEATTPRLVEYLHSPADLGRDIVDFHERVRPIWKLGVLYRWGRPGNYEFPWPFQYGSLLEPYLYEGDISAHCLGALLMAGDRVPVFDDGDGSQISLLDAIPFAYHVDNPRFVRYLREEAERAGVTRADRVIADAELTPDGESVRALVAEGGERFESDLYVDCTGFRSVLLAGKLGSPFVSYDDSLFTDAAVVANVPHDGTVKPYTVAESMDSGWCWNIAFEDCDHRGYVFSSAFCSAEEAEAEMRAKNPGMGDAWSLRFRSGRHEQFWKGNVVAIGNAYAFVEPLASTAIHMLLFELDLVTATLPAHEDVALKDVLNRQANEMWDNLRGWLAVQYKFNARFQTPFWQACRADVELAAAAPYVERFRARAPLASATPAPGPAGGVVLPRYANDYFAQEYVYDVMLFGQDVACRHAEPSESREQWTRRIGRAREMARWALPQAEALELARQRPEILTSLLCTPGSWLGEHLY